MDRKILGGVCWVRDRLCYMGAEVMIFDVLWNLTITEQMLLGALIGHAFFFGVFYWKLILKMMAIEKHLLIEE